MAKAGRKPIDFKDNAELLGELHTYLSRLKYLKANDERCIQFYKDFAGGEVPKEDQKWLLVLRRDMLAQRKRDALLKEISAKEYASELEILAWELSQNDDRDSFFNLQKVLDLLLSKKNEKQTFSSKKKALERKIYEQEKKQVSKAKMENQKKFFLGGLLINLQEEIRPDHSEIDFLKEILDAYCSVTNIKYDVYTATKQILVRAGRDPRCPEDYVDELYPNY